MHCLSEIKISLAVLYFIWQPSSEHQPGGGEAEQEPGPLGDRSKVLWPKPLLDDCLGGTSLQRGRSSGTRPVGSPPAQSQAGGSPAGGAGALSGQSGATSQENRRSSATLEPGLCSLVWTPGPSLWSPSVSPSLGSRTLLLGQVVQMPA